MKEMCHQNAPVGIKIQQQLTTTTNTQQNKQQLTIAQMDLISWVVMHTVVEKRITLENINSSEMSTRLVISC